jgi:hypothetical protein
MVVADGLTATEGVTTEFTIIVTGLEVAVADVTQVSVEVISTVTASPSFKPVLENVDPVPAGELFTYH